VPSNFLLNTSKFSIEEFKNPFRQVINPEISIKLVEGGRENFPYFRYARTFNSQKGKRVRHNSSSQLSSPGGGCHPEDIASAERNRKSFPLSPRIWK
jgi:hypothetical protein